MRKDQKRRPVNPDKCAIAGCKRAPGPSYYGYALCNRHFDKYMGSGVPKNALKTILGIKDAPRVGDAKLREMFLEI